MNISIMKPAFRIPAKSIRAEHCVWPGGYPLSYYDFHDGSVVCPDCATLERFKVKLTADVHWEGPSDFCDVCGAEMESAYGDPWAEEDKEEG